jgi:hypothetical protein
VTCSYATKVTIYNCRNSTDVQLAERLLRQGTRSADPVQGARQLEAALTLWRGRPLADLAGLPWLEEQAERLELLGVQVKLALSEARLAGGEHLALVPDLEQLADERPLDEQVHAQLMLALYRSGRPADALAAYRRLRLTLDEEMGIDPAQGLRDLEAAILRQDPGLDPPGPAAAPPLAPPRVTLGPMVLANDTRSQVPCRRHTRVRVQHRAARWLRRYAGAGKLDHQGWPGPA